MKIDKVLFSCSPSPEYSPFWNVQARIFKTKLGIEPVCLLYGKKAETDMSEEHGKIIEVEADPSLPWSVQMTWAKFDYPTREPDTTWLIGDIDLVPLQRAHFTDRIADITSEAYIHLNAGGISQPRLGCMDGFLTHGSQRHVKDQGRNGGTDIPAHYHVAKGKNFNVLTQGRPFLDQVRHIVETNRYGMGVMDNYGEAKRAENPYWYYWCGEENYSSELILNAIRNGSLAFVPIYYNNNNGADRVNRDEFRGDYTYDHAKCAAQGYVDVHCARPYSKQHEQLARMLKLAWGE
jgi:hypothetical protein